MMQMLFFLRFKTQLRRTRPELVSRLEKAVAGAVEAAGGKLTGERRLLTAFFQAGALGFWLDMLILIETVMGLVEDAAGDLYGYALVLGGDMESASAERICRFLSSGPQGGGVWLDHRAEKGLSPYVNMEETGVFKEDRAGIRSQDRALIDGFTRLGALKDFSGLRPNFPLQETIQRALARGSRRNAVLLGPDFCGKRQGLYRFYQELCFARNLAVEDAPPLIIRFDTGGIACLADAWMSRRQVPASGTAPRKAPDEIDVLAEAIFRNRLRDEISPDGAKQARRFFTLVLDAFVSEPGRRNIPPLIILENIHQADKTAARIFLEAYAALPAKQVLVLGTCSAGAPDMEEQLKFWEPVFPRVIKLKAGGAGNREISRVPPELWEIAYALALLGRFFPGRLFPRLFAEEGKNPAMLSRALSLLYCFGMADTPDDPRPRLANFIPQAEGILGNRTEAIRCLVKNRLLDWVNRSGLSPCFSLLESLAELGGGGGGDDLVLRAVSSDVINGTCRGIDTAIRQGRLEKITGPERIAAVEFIIKTLKALHHGDGGMIRSVFQELPPECAFSPVFKSQILANLSAFHLGTGDSAFAAETVKEGILLGQGKNGAVLAQSYRLFALVNLSRQRIREAIDYLDFAVDNAEKSGNKHELAVSSYYAAAAQFLYGNLSKAQRFTRQAGEQAAIAGDDAWADRARFLRGRLCFETGRYRDALELFESLGNSSGPPEKEGLLAAWIYRTKSYAKIFPAAKPANGGLDADMFEIEAAYLEGNYEKAAELSGALAGFHHEDFFLFTEQADWRSGFAQAELLLFPQGMLWSRMISVYHALSLSRLSPSGGAEAQHSMQRVLRDERFTEIDPWDAFYFFAWYQVLENSGAAQVDMNTAMSMAFKRLQRRASRIDDIETRRDFLSLPRWNSALSLAAKEYKLI
jgi:tetratricopeptide (TPR) repeat protein